MRYQVRFVDDTALPEGVDWTFARLAGETFLFVKNSAIDTTTGECDALTRAWKCWQVLKDAKPAGKPSRAQSEVGHLRNMTPLLLAAYGVPAAKVGRPLVVFPDA